MSDLSKDIDLHRLQSVVISVLRVSKFDRGVARIVVVEYVVKHYFTFQFPSHFQFYNATCISVHSCLLYLFIVYLRQVFDNIWAILITKISRQISWIHETSLATSLVIEVYVPSMESERSCIAGICVSGVGFVSISKIFILDFGTVQAVGYFLFFISLACRQQLAFMHRCFTVTTRNRGCDR